VTGMSGDRAFGRVVAAIVVAAMLGLLWLWEPPRPAEAQGEDFGPWYGTVRLVRAYDRPLSSSYYEGREVRDETFQITTSPTSRTWSWTRNIDYTTYYILGHPPCLGHNVVNDGGEIPSWEQVTVEYSAGTQAWVIRGAGAWQAWYTFTSNGYEFCGNYYYPPSSAGWEYVPVISARASGSADATTLSGEAAASPGEPLSEARLTYSFTRERLGPPPPPPAPRGKVTWSDAYPDRVGQGVQGATVTVGSQTFQTDSNGEYEITSDLVGQDATVTLPLFDHGTAAAMELDGEPVFAKALGANAAGAPAAAGSNVRAKVSEEVTLTLNTSTGKLNAVGNFGDKVKLDAFGQTFTLTNLKMTDQGFQSLGTTAQLAFKYDPNSPPIALNVTINYVKASNQLTINGVSGSQFQWGGQTATLTKFVLESSPTVNSVSMEASVNLSLSQVPITATITGDGTAQGVVLKAAGSAVIQGITVELDPITVENGQFHVKGRVKLPNQSVHLAFDTTTGFSAPDLVLPLPQFQWDGQALPVELVLRGNGLILRGKGNVQIGGQAVELTLDTAVNLGPGTTTVRASATIPLPDGGKASAKLEYDPTKPQNSSVTGTMKVFLALCPGKKTDFNVDVRASASNIKLGFNTQIPVDCDGNGTSTLVNVQGDFDGQLAQLRVAWPVTVGNFNGKVAATAKSDGTYFEIMFNVELKFGPGGGQSSSATSSARSSTPGVPRPDIHPAAASDVRVLLTDGVGRRTGFDPATGQLLNEIPGGRWDGLVNGMDTFTMPGRVGGYAVTLFSTTPKQAELAMTVGGQTKSFTASVGPGAPTTLAAETVPQNGAVQTQIAPVAVGCAPRPRVQIAPAPGGGALRATFTAGPGSSAATNAIREIRIGQQVLNGVVDAEGRTGLGAGAVITFPSPVTSATLVVRRVRPGEATTVPLTIVDGCGEWKTFVGGGAAAGF
jgi:hypothetical protein